MFMDIYVFVVQMRWIADGWVRRRRVSWVAWMGWVASALSPLWIADQVRNDVTMRCIVFTLCSQCQALGQALVLSRQGRGGIWLVVLACSPSSPCRPVDTALKPV